MIAIQLSIKYRFTLKTQIKIKPNQKLEFDLLALVMVARPRCIGSPSNIELPRLNSMTIQIHLHFDAERVHTIPQPLNHKFYFHHGLHLVSSDGHVYILIPVSPHHQYQHVGLLAHTIIGYIRNYCGHMKLAEGIGSHTLLTNHVWMVQFFN